LKKSLNKKLKQLLKIMSMQNLDLVCFSHLRWNFVFQRPQHLLTRFARNNRVFYIEEPVFTDQQSFCQVTSSEKNLFIVVPHLAKHLNEQEKLATTKELLSKLFQEHEIRNYIFWYYSPMILSISQGFTPELIVFDCMDELSAFKFAPASLLENEALLLEKADLVFTGGHSLYEAKKHRHKSIYPFPSSIDKEHFQQSRAITVDHPDQASIPHPRFGFYGVIDERMDIDLIGKVAELNPGWHFVMIGPIVKIDQDSLPRFPNIHYLGSKSYQELPSYLSGWDIAMIPFALNESTRFISPTKTPEYLAAGKPVISSSIRDVVHPYGENKLVHIADTPEDFISAAEVELNTTDKTQWLSRVDEFLKEISWDNTWKEMIVHINEKLSDKAQVKKNSKQKLKENIYV
jgi:UDP-galactopyranose mutase